MRRSQLALALCYLTSNAAAMELVAHRGGVSGVNSFIPEHSYAAYAMGAANGAAVIEPDVVSTKDGVMMVMHGNELSGTSDVADKFPDRYTTKSILGSTKSGYFSEDFLWSEIQTLRLKSRNYKGQGSIDGIYGFLTFDEMLDYASTLSSQVSGRANSLGVYPETKLAPYFRSLGLPLEEKVVESLALHHYCAYDTSTPPRCLVSLADASSASGRAWLQSFYDDSLKILYGLTDIPLFLLATGDLQDDFAKGDVLKDIKAYGASGVSLPVSVPETSSTFNHSNFEKTVAHCNDLGLIVHAWTGDTSVPLYEYVEQNGVAALFTNNVPFAVGSMSAESLCEDVVPDDDVPSDDVPSDPVVCGDCDDDGGFGSSRLEWLVRFGTLALGVAAGYCWGSKQQPRKMCEDEKDQVNLRLLNVANRSA